MNGRTIAEDMEREYQRQSLRDQFAAAALTGFASQLRCGSVFNLTLTAKQCYELADAMLRERSRTGQKMAESDSSRAACPERDKLSAETHNGRGSVTPVSYAKSDENRGDSPAKREPTEPRNGALGEPVAWAVQWAGEDIDVRSVFSDRESAEREFANYHGENTIVPLYRHPQPTLTDAEREAVEWYAAYGRGDHADTLRGLLERLK